MGVFARGRRLWIRTKDANGKWVSLRTRYVVGEEAKAKRLLREAVDRVAAGEAVVGRRTEPVTVREYAELRWFPMRRGYIASASRDERRLVLHAFPAIGGMRLEAVRPRHLADLFRALRGGELSPKSRHNVYGVLRALFRDAQIDGLIDASPCILTEHQLGPNVDGNSEWRDTAVYSRDEMALLLFAPIIPLERRIAYALMGAAGLRHGEMAGLRWRHLSEAAPLGRVMVATSYDKGRTKTGTTRYVPIHPALAGLLEEWRAGWVEMMGRPYTAADLVAPTPRPTNRGPRVALGSMRTDGWTWKRLAADLELLGLRHRRGHDLRRTFISLARSDGAAVDVLRRATHRPPREVIEGYTTFEWGALCREVAKLQIGRPALNLVTRSLQTHGEAMNTAKQNGLEAVGIEAPSERNGRIDSGHQASRTSVLSVVSETGRKPDTTRIELETDGACNDVTDSPTRARLRRLMARYAAGGR